MAKKPSKKSGYEQRQPVADKPNPNRAGKMKPVIDHHGKNVRRGQK